MRRCVSYSRMPIELRQAVFQPQRYFSNPLDFQRKRGPWGRGLDGAKICGQNDGELRAEKRSSDNPFKPQRAWRSDEIASTPNRLNDSLLLGEFESDMKSSNVLHSTPGEKGSFDFGVRLREVKKLLGGNIAKDLEDNKVEPEKVEEERESSGGDSAGINPCTTATSSSTVTSTTTATTRNGNKGSPVTSEDVLPNSSEEVVIIGDSSGTSSSDGQKSYEVNVRTEGLEGEAVDDPAKTGIVIHTGKTSEKVQSTPQAEEREEEALSELGEYDENEDDQLEEEEVVVEEFDNGELTEEVIPSEVQAIGNEINAQSASDLFTTCHVLDNEGVFE